MCAFGRCLGREGGTIKNGIIILIKETTQSSLAPSTLWDYSEKMAI